jgi:DNA transformation protein
MATHADELTIHSIELLSPLGAVRWRRMFGGVGLYVDDLFIALIAFERLFLKVDALTRDRFVAAGCEPFRYEAKGQQVSIAYFTAPDDAMESPGLMQPWARLALEAALRARAAKAPSVRARAKATPPASRARPRKAAASS